MPVDTEELTENAEDRTESEPTEVSEDAADSDIDDDTHSDPGQRRKAIQWRRVITYGVLPGLAVVLVMAAGYLKWYDSSARDSRLAGIESVRAASDGTVAMLSYRPDTIDNDLGAARDRLTGALKDSYTSLTHDVVIPGAKQRQISAAATVAAAASVSASPNRAVVLLFVNQTVIVGNDPPTNTASRVRVTLDKVDGRWLISAFDPI